MASIHKIQGIKGVGPGVSEQEQAILSVEEEFHV
jgi:hypothetical protein